MIWIPILAQVFVLGFAVGIIPEWSLYLRDRRAARDRQLALIAELEEWAVRSGHDEATHIIGSRGYGPTGAYGKDVPRR